MKWEGQSSYLFLHTELCAWSPFSCQKSYVIYSTCIQLELLHQALRTIEPLWHFYTPFASQHTKRLYLLLYQLPKLLQDYSVLVYQIFVLALHIEIEHEQQFISSYILDFRQGIAWRSSIWPFNTNFPPFYVSCV